MNLFAHLEELEVEKYVPSFAYWIWMYGIMSWYHEG